MQRTWWPEAGTIIVTGPYCRPPVKQTGARAYGPKQRWSILLGVLQFSSRSFALWWHSIKIKHYVHVHSWSVFTPKKIIIVSISVSKRLCMSRTVCNLVIGDNSIQVSRYPFTIYFQRMSIDWNTTTIHWSLNKMVVILQTIRSRLFCWMGNFNK